MPKLARWLQCNVVTPVVVGVTQKGDSLFVNCSFTVTSSVLRSLVAPPGDARAPSRGLATSKRRERWETSAVGNPG